MSEENAVQANQFTGLVTAALDSMSPSVVQNVVRTIAQLMEMMDVINKPETLELLQEFTRVSQSLTEMLKEIEKLQASGALETLVEVSGVLKSARDSMTAPVIQGMLGTGVKAFGMVDDLLQYEGDKLVSGMVKAAYDSRADIASGQNGKSMSLFQMAKMLKDPEIQKSLQFVFGLLQNLPKHMED